MVRAKKPIPTESQLETQSLLNDAKTKFAADLVELEKAKRAFSTAFVDEVMKQIESMLPTEVLDMKANEFVAQELEKRNRDASMSQCRSVCAQTNPPETVTEEGNLVFRP